MSQQRARKAGGVAEAGQGNAAGDSKTAVPPKNHTSSSNKIPKGLRYDLENALVSLCDVWFDEIKPHLVRNNIKLHVHGGVAGSASGDHPRLPPGAPGCSHLDPGAAPDRYQWAYANCADFSSTQPTASKARCRRPPAPPPQASPQAYLLPASSAPPRSHSCPQNQCRIYEAKQSRVRSVRRSWRAAPAQSKWRTPHLSRAYSVLTPSAATCPPSRTRTANPQHYGNYSKQKPKTIDKSTQTPAYHPENSQSARQPRTRRSSRSSGDERLVMVPRQRCPVSSTLRQRKHRSPFRAPPLFQDELLDIIANKYEDHLKVLFKSPRPDPSNSSLNLVLTRSRSLRPPRARIMPWK